MKYYKIVYVKNIEIKAHHPLKHYDCQTIGDIIDSGPELSSVTTTILLIIHYSTAWNMRFKITEICSKYIRNIYITIIEKMCDINYI